MWTFTLFDKKILKSKGENSNRIINLCVSKLMVIEFNRILAKELQRINNFFDLFIYFFYSKLIFFNPVRDRMLDLHMSTFLVAEVPFSTQPAYPSVSTFLSL